MIDRPAPITEVKRHLDGRVERFDCALVLRRPHVVVLRHEGSRAYRVGDARIPKGSVTYGFFWKRRPYQLYRIAGPDGAIIGHRFDVVEDVRFEGARVSYLDLVLDVWVGAAGVTRVDDEEEVQDYLQRGLLTPDQRERIERTRALLLRRHRAIAREAAQLLDATT